MEQTFSRLIHEVLVFLKQEGYTEKGVKKHSKNYSLLVSYAMLLQKMGARLQDRDTILLLLFLYLAHLMLYWLM